jgi:hypothetical protein
MAATPVPMAPAIKLRRSTCMDTPCHFLRLEGAVEALSRASQTYLT